ncbi:hypothetical protein BW39_01443 [Delftia sp. RIT313]|nr:hypothetical protein BW39_01443 [Delftia sp. RIT313]
MLTDTALRNLKPKSKIYKASVRDLMYVTVSPTGTVTRCSLAISARAAANSDAGTTPSPADTAVKAPWRSSLRH